MNRSTVGNQSNVDVIEDQQRRWREDPGSVDETWRIFFEGYELGSGGRDTAAVVVSGPKVSDGDPDRSDARARRPSPA